MEIDILVFWPGLRTSPDALLPRLGQIVMSHYTVGTFEVLVDDGRPMRVDGSTVAPIAREDLTPRVGMMPRLPVRPGTIALALQVGPDASYDEWLERLGDAWAEMQVIRKAQRVAWHAEALTNARSELRDARDELARAHGPDREMLATHVQLLETRLEELRRAPRRRTPVRIDLPFRELAWLREFLTGKTPTEIAADWEDRTAGWRSGTAGADLQDEVIGAAREEWRGRTQRQGAVGTDSATVERSLKRWLGKSIANGLSAGNSKTGSALRPQRQRRVRSR